MVCRFLRLRFIGKRRKSVGFPVTDAMLWSPFNQISTRDSALVLKLEVNRFKSHWCSQMCFRNQPCHIATHVLLINLHIIVCIGVSTRPKKHHPLFLAKRHSLNLHTVQASPFLGNPPIYNFFLRTPLS